MNSKDLNKQLEALKRQAIDLGRDLHARKLLIPAGAILAAIIAAVVLLPKGSAPLPAPTTTTLTPQAKAKIQVAAQISTIDPTPLGDDIPLAGSNNPFTGEEGYDCEVIQSEPKILGCIVADTTKLIVLCGDSTAGECAKGGGGATAAAGGASGGAGTGSGSDSGSGTIPPADGGGGGDSGSGGGGGIKYFYYAATVKLDDTTYKKVPGGTMLPKSSSPLVAYYGETADVSGGTFLAASGVTVSGVSIDPIFSSFSLEIGQTVTLTDADGKNHKLTLKSIDLVEQK